MTQSGCLLVQRCLLQLLLARSVLGRFASAVYVGCYSDGMSPRDLDGLFNVKNVGGYPVQANYGYASSSTGMTVQLCTSICSLGGFSYLGLQSAIGCYCGSSYGRYGAQLDSSCSSPCSGNLSQMCGGTGKNSVYKIMYSDGCSGRFRQAPRANLSVFASYSLPTHWSVRSSDTLDCALKCKTNCQAFIYSQKQGLCRLLTFALVPEEISSVDGEFYCRI